MERLVVAGSLRLPFMHRPSKSVQQNQIFLQPIYSKPPLPWRKTSTWKRLVSSASSNAEVFPDNISKGHDESTLDETVDDLDSHLMSAEKLQLKDDDLMKLRSDLAILEFELQDMIGLAEEVVNSEISPGTRNVDGESIQSLLLSRMKAVHKKLHEQIEGVDLIKSQNVTLYWVGMAECVQVMGSFDGWSQGEEMSPEYDGSYNRFSATLSLRPGRYEVKFLVDGKWTLSSELPTVGEGLMQNNLLVV